MAQADKPNKHDKAQVCSTIHDLFSQPKKKETIQKYYCAVLIFDCITYATELHPAAAAAADLKDCHDIMIANSTTHYHHVQKVQPLMHCRIK